MKKLYTIKDLLKTDYKARRKLSDKENIKIISELKPSALNRWNDYKEKYKKLKEVRGYFPEAHAYSTDSPLFSLLIDQRNLTELTSAELRHQVKVLYNFFKTKTSTMSGWLKVIDKFEKRFEREVNKKYRLDIKLNREDYERFWQVYNRVTEVINPNTLNSNYEIWREIAEYIEQKEGEFDSEEWANEVISKIEKKTLEGAYNSAENNSIGNKYVYKGNKTL